MQIINIAPTARIDGWPAWRRLSLCPTELARRVHLLTELALPNSDILCFRKHHLSSRELIFSYGHGNCSLAATFFPQRKRTHLPKYYFWHDYFFSKVPRQVASYAYLRKCSWDCYLAYFSFCMLMPTHMCMRERGSEHVLGDVCTLALFPIIIARHFCFAKW